MILHLVYLLCISHLLIRLDILIISSISGVLTTYWLSWVLKHIFIRFLDKMKIFVIFFFVVFSNFSLSLLGFLKFYLWGLNNFRAIFFNEWDMNICFDIIIGAHCILYSYWHSRCICSRTKFLLGRKLFVIIIVWIWIIWW